MFKIKSIFTICLFCVALIIKAHAVETAFIIKVTGSYGIINKGVNQGLKNGQILYVKRVVNYKLTNIAQVKVIRTTANRAAVEQISKNEKYSLKKGDKLYTDNLLNSNTNQNRTKNIPPRPKTSSKQSVISTSKIDPIIEPAHKKNDAALQTPNRYYSRNYKLKNPWLSINFGAIFPDGELANSYSPSYKFGASYMISASRTFKLGIEINKTIFSEASFDNNNLVGFKSIASSSILEVFVVFQKYFGNNFFIETGGGIFRPKIRMISTDNYESIYSTSNFGIFGGTGFFVPTSEYAGFTLKGRIHNYFDQTSKQYFGLSGGFQFKIQ